LFDVDGMNRKIDFREFLRCETQDTLRALATRLKICNKIYIIVDSMSIRFNAIATRFYVKTLLQSYCFVRGIKDERPVVLVMNAATKGKILPYIRQYVLLEKSPVPI
ncbi:MAG: hypothetical protein IJU05_00560, partial [Schwartzia sp.]|nr:hypothetical protein [Schwartzia sp. (in: firmicutes)]